MRRRSAVTLLEVLIALFIMAIGMLALLVLFPLGAFSMGKALKDDHCASSSHMAEQLAIAANLRHDMLIIGPPPGNNPAVDLFLTNVNLPPNNQTLPASYSGPSFAVYVDPYGVQGGLTALGGDPGIQRSVNPSYSSGANASVLIDRWFSFPNGIGFLSTGTPDLSNGAVERGRNFSWAYMLRRPQSWTDKAIDMTVVVYYNRPTAVPSAETAYVVSQTPVASRFPMAVTTTSGPTQGAGGMVLTGASIANFRRGMWLVDISPITGTGGNTGIPTIPRSDFYRIVNVDDMGGGQVAVDVQPNLICDNNPNGNPVTNVVLLDNVAEVFPKGTSWQP